MKENLREIASHFALEGPVTAIDSLGEGFINDTFIVRTEADAPDYILQRKNKAVFPDVPAMMDNIRRVTEHIRRGVIAAGGDPRREVMTVVPAKDGHLYHVDAEGEYWAATVFIDDTIAYNKADSPELARKGGEGIGKFQSQLDDFTEPLAETIKGFHNIRHRFGQWDAALARDAAGRRIHLAEEIGWIESRRAEMLSFWSKVEDGTIPTRVTHNDTKINNILFDKQGEVLCAPRRRKAAVIRLFSVDKRFGIVRQLLFLDLIANQVGQLHMRDIGDRHDFSVPVSLFNPECLMQPEPSHAVFLIKSVRVCFISSGVWSRQNRCARSQIRSRIRVLYTLLSCGLPS